MRSQIKGRGSGERCEWQCLVERLGTIRVKSFYLNDEDCHDEYGKTLWNRPLRKL